MQAAGQENLILPERERVTYKESGKHWLLTARLGLRREAMSPKFYCNTITSMEFYSYSIIREAWAQTRLSLYSRRGQRDDFACSKKKCYERGKYTVQGNRKPPEERREMNSQDTVVLGQSRQDGAGGQTDSSAGRWESRHWGCWGGGIRSHGKLYVEECSSSAEEFRKITNNNTENQSGEENEAIINKTFMSN